MLESKPRYEFKYVIDLETVARLRPKIEEVMHADPYAVEGGYHVNSLYYDTTDFRAYYEKLDGLDDRFKLRLRHYGEHGPLQQSEGPFFLEAKHRERDLIRKDRVKLSAELADPFCEGPLLVPRLRDEVEPEQRGGASILEHLILQKPVEPVCVVSYFREPYMCRIDPGLRITFDSDLRTYGPLRFRRTSSDDGLSILPANLVILEIKFHWAMPLWLVSVCRSLGLDLRRYSKFCASMEALHPRLTRRAVRRADIDISPDITVNASGGTPPHNSLHQPTGKPQPDNGIERKAA